jgi:Glycerol uptake facilitator and related permeases (Major Intrinsic Protein Family)
MAETTATPSYTRRLIAEVFGTFVLVFGVIGVALNYGEDAKPLVVGLAVGIAVLAAAYAVGHVSGGHFNPAVTLGVAAAGRMPWKDVLPYVVAQLVGGLLATLVHLAIVASQEKDIASSFAAVSNGYDGAFAPLVTVIILEIAITAVFLWIILGVTAEGSTTAGFAPLAIGLALALFHFIAIPLDNASLNPARSLATAVFGGAEPLGQVWVFFVAPLVGGLIAGLTYKPLFGRKG